MMVERRGGMLFVERKRDDCFACIEGVCQCYCDLLLIDC